MTPIAHPMLNRFLLHGNPLRDGRQQLKMKEKTEKMTPSSAPRMISMIIASPSPQGDKGASAFEDTCASDEESSGIETRASPVDTNALRAGSPMQATRAARRSTVGGASFSVGDSGTDTRLRESRSGSSVLVDGGRGTVGGGRGGGASVGDSGGADGADGRPPTMAAKSSRSIDPDACRGTAIGLGRLDEPPGTLSGIGGGISTGSASRGGGGGHGRFGRGGRRRS